MVLLIEDNDKLRRLLRHSLQDAGYDVRESRSGQLGLQLAAKRWPDVIILDLGLPDIEGAEVIATLRQWSQTKPILVLSGRNSEAEKVATLELGADDYVVKPFTLPELLARVRAAIRRSSRQINPISAFSSHGVSVDIERRQATRNGDPVALTRNEFRVLAVLVRNAGLLVSADSLVRELWGPKSSANKRIYLRSYLANLRLKLEDTPAQPKLLLTEPGVGYRIALDVNAHGVDDQN